MTDLYVYDMSAQDAEMRRKLAITVVFCATPDVNLASIQARLKTHFDTAVPPDAIIFFGTTACKNRFQELINDPSLVESLPAYTRGTTPAPVHALTIDDHGTIAHDGPPHSLMTRSAFHQALQQQGIICLFRKRGALLRSGPAFHYSKPSERHTDTFIRAANVLVESAEIAFIASCILQYLAHNPRHIYTDTPTMNALAYSCVLIKQQVSPGYQTPAISSFHSYSGYRTHASPPFGKPGFG